MSYLQIWVCKLLQLIGLIGRIWSINSIIQILGADSPGILVCLASILFPDCHVMHRNANDKVVTTNSTMLSGQWTGKDLLKSDFASWAQKSNNGRAPVTRGPWWAATPRPERDKPVVPRAPARFKTAVFGRGFFRLFHGVFGQFHCEGDLCCLKTWFIVCNRRLDEAWSRQIKGFEVDKRISSDTRINFDDVWTLNTRCRCFYSLMWYFSTSGGILTSRDQILNDIVKEVEWLEEKETSTLSQIRLHYKVWRPLNLLLLQI